MRGAAEDEAVKALVLVVTLLKVVGGFVIVIKVVVGEDFAALSIVCVDVFTLLSLVEVPRTDSVDSFAVVCVGSLACGAATLSLFPSILLPLVAFM